MPRPSKKPIDAMKEQLKAAKQRVIDAKAEVTRAEANVQSFERCVKILEEQEPTPTLIPASAVQTEAKKGK